VTGVAKTGLTITIKIDGATETLRAFRDLPKDATNRLRDKAGEIADALRPAVEAAARTDTSPQSKLVAGTVKVKRDRIPALVAGGTKRLGVNRVPAYKLLFGSEFGSVRYKQFNKLHQGQEGSWFFPVVEREAARISAAWNEAADEIIAEFSGGQ
jgi:hypothetical protein